MIVFTLFGNDEGHDGFAPVGVGDPDHGDLSDTVDVDDLGLDLGGVDVHASGDDHVVLAVEQVQEAVGVEPADVAGSEPPAGQERLVVQGRIGVAQEELRPPGHDLPVDSRAHLAVVVVEQADLVAGRQDAVGAGPLVQRVKGRAGADHRVLGRSVGAKHRDPRPIGSLDERARHAGRTDQVVADRGQVSAVGLGRVEQGGEEERGARGRRHAVGLDELGCMSGVPAVHDHGCRAEQRGAQQPEDPGDVAGGEGGEIDPSGLVECLGHRPDLSGQGVGRMLHALGVGGGPRGVDQQADLVGVEIGDRFDRLVVGELGPGDRVARASVGLADDHDVLEGVGPVDGLEMHRIVDRAPLVGHDQYLRPGLAEDEADLGRAVDVDDGHDRGTDHPSRLVGDRTFGPVGHPDGDDVSGLDTERSESTGETLRPFIEVVEAQALGLWPADEVQCRVGKGCCAVAQTFSEVAVAVEPGLVPSLAVLPRIDGGVEVLGRGHGVDSAAVYSSRIFRL